VLPGLAGLLAAAVLAGAGVGAVTPLGFAALAASAPPGRLGQTMGAAEVGRELGDAGGPLLVGAFGLISLAAGFGALAAVLTICAALIAPRNRVREDPADGHPTS
jgi:MFS family permease